jgi:site-specific recombinase XerD
MRTKARQVESNSEWFRSIHGAIKVYSRHVNGCKRTDPDDNRCACPKWAYENRPNHPRRRYALNTPSLSEARAEAKRIFDAWDPTKKQQNNRTTVEAAIQMWLDRTRNMFGEDADIVNQYRSTFGWRDAQGNARGNLLKYVERWNETHQREPIVHIQEITPLFCQEWHDSWNGSYSDDTRKQRWGTVRSFFKFLTDLGVLDVNPAVQIKAVKARQVFAHVPFTDEQYERILNEADWYVDERVKNGEREVHCRRQHLFLELLRNTGMDLGDAVMFQSSLIRDEVVDGKTVSVLRYRRSKTGVEAIIVIDTMLAEGLRNIPLAPMSVPYRPFRYQGNQLHSDVHNWSRRVARLIKLAKIGRLQLINRDGTEAVDDRGLPITRNPDTKMLRHSFAVGQLLKGLRPEVVAKQLGHVDTAMILKHYAPWCKERDLQHLREQMI